MTEHCYDIARWASFMPSDTNAEYHIGAFYADCHYAECHYAECRGADLCVTNNIQYGMINNLTMFLRERYKTFGFQS